MQNEIHEIENERKIDKFPTKKININSIENVPLTR